jgi:pseudouridine-5'-phosphate glycosidase
MLGAFVSLLLLPLASGSELRIHPEVQRALAERRPVVALESTIISHGMPYPDNLRTAREVEEVVRSCGATPATIAILDGVCCIGLADEELERFAQLGSAGEVRKVSRRDLAHAVARNAHGGTTVSSTMLLAHKAGIAVFVTGGIGGVHRGGESSMDVSADLVELGRTPVLVVSAGIKSILDIPRTLEYLETQGVAVLALGTDEFPAFFTRSSGCAAPMVASGCAEAAAVCHTQLDRLRLQSGLLVGVPIPAEAEAEAEVVQLAIQQALADAEAAATRHPTCCAGWPSSRRVAHSRPTSPWSRTTRGTAPRLQARSRHCARQTAATKLTKLTRRRRRRPLTKRWQRGWRGRWGGWRALHRTRCTVPESWRRRLWQGWQGRRRWQGQQPRRLG